jgi:hypothetical protein
MLSTLPTGSHKCRETRSARAALLTRLSGRSRLPRNDPSTISSPATSAADPDKPGRPRSDRQPRNHSPPALTRTRVQISDTVASQDSGCLTVDKATPAWPTRAPCPPAVASASLQGYGDSCSGDPRGGPRGAFMSRRASCGMMILLPAVASWIRWYGLTLFVGMDRAPPTSLWLRWPGARREEQGWRREPSIGSARQRCCICGRGMR